LKEAFLKMLLKGFDLDFTPKKIEKDLFDVHFSWGEKYRDGV
jgi:hypothetical protein